MTLSLETYRAEQAAWAVNQGWLRRVLSELQPGAREALGPQLQRHTLWGDDLPVFPVMTTPQTNGGWGELMPIWFKAYERPIPLFCLDNWALFAGLYRAALGIGQEEVYFSVEYLSRIMIASNLLTPFLPTTQGLGHFLRHGALTVLLGICWLDEPGREAWLRFHASSAQSVAAEMPSLATPDALDAWLIEIEAGAFMIPDQTQIAGEAAVVAFLADQERVHPYLKLLRCLSLSVTALAAHYGPDWQQWAYQAITLDYRLPTFGLSWIQTWVLEAGTKAVPHDSD